jgi:hypothetical protein
MANVFGTMLRRVERTINTRQTYKFFMRDWKALTDLQNCARVVSTMRFNQTLEPLEMSCPEANGLRSSHPSRR